MAAAVALPDATLNLSTIGGGGGPSALRAPYASSHAPSMADTLPSLQNFGFDDLRARMAQFTSRFDDFIERGRVRVLEERNAFRMGVAEINEQQASSGRAVQALRQKTAAHASQLGAQSSETAEMHGQIAALAGTRDGHAEHAERLRGRLGAARNALAARKAALRERREYLAYQAGFDGPELRFWEERLGMRVEGAGREDRVRFGFLFDEGRREAWFEVDMRAGFEVVGARPGLERCEERVGRLAREMAAREDLGAFLKGMREIFLEVMR